VLEFQESETLCCGAAVALPVRDTTADEFEALLVKDAVAAAVPLDWGVNWMPNETLWPAGRVSGRDNPLTLNSGLVMPASVTVRLEPLAVRVPVRLLLCPTITLPKFSVAGLTASWPLTMAVPAREIVRVALEASDRTEIVPLALPPVVGAKTTPKVKLCPGLRAIGRDNPVTWKILLETLAWLMVTLAPPELVTVSDWVPLPPTGTLKLRLGSLLLSTPGVPAGSAVAETATAETGTLITGFAALLATAILPAAVPAVCGANVTEKVLLSPAAKVMGKGSPLIPKPRPVTDA
jgi:hypothetical protein